ncbi:carbohydrate ABC transporter permease [Aestuariivirga sp.]|jgi:multiple sugar transport system permease protein|uniref:carbohydrate ABC transporter permease n=1 Tax=Aestuariivirga sp. TaxID=2650926 RepID=UPI00378430DA
MSKRMEGPRWGWIVLTIWGIFSFLPILFFASIALRPRNEIIAPVPIYFPTITIETWAKIWNEWPIGLYFYNSVVAVSGSVFICLILGVPAAYALARYKFKGNADIGNYILSTKMMAPAAVVVPMFFLFGKMGLIDSVWALMLVYAAMNLSIVVWIVRSYMIDIPPEIEDAARTDGATDLRILWEIIIPMCLPGIITAAVIAAIFAMNEYLFTLIIASKNAYPLSVALANFSGGSDGIIYNAIALVGFLAFFPALLLVILIQNHLSRGLTMGAVKG